MSDFVLHKGQKVAKGLARSYGADPVALSYVPSGPTVVTLEDGRSGPGSCLGCNPAPCIVKHPSELSLASSLEAFPGDPSLDVCPTAAITFNSIDGVATVDQDACIGCGLCASRCPYGAIHLASGEAAKVTVDDPGALIKGGASQTVAARPDRSGAMGISNAKAISRLPESVAGLNDARANLLVRNLLHEVGLNARVRRRGDTNMRIDAAGFSRRGRPFAAEIELSGGVLESPRALLEDVAVLHARYGFEVKDVDALSVVLALPNLRSEYYQVIRDIEAVLGIRCRTATVGALAALMWSCAEIEEFAGNNFAVGDGALDLTSSLKLSKPLAQEPYPGAFKPAK